MESFSLSTQVKLRVGSFNEDIVCMLTSRITTTSYNYTHLKVFKKHIHVLTNCNLLYNIITLNMLQYRYTTKIHII